MAQEPQEPAIEDIRAALIRVLASTPFTTSVRASRFLRYLVEAELDGRRERLKEIVVGVEVFDRRSSFDPRIDNIVRVEATKLRGRLRKYYRGIGRNDTILIEVPRGAYVPRFKQRTKRALRRTKEPVMVVVLPFLNVDGDNRTEYLSDGITDELIGALSRSGFRVLSRTSASSFKSKSVDLTDIRRRFDAELVIEGSTRVVHELVRITARLVETKTGTLIKSVAAEGKANDLWAVHREITTALLDEVRKRISTPKSANLDRDHQINSEAFELCLRGRHLAASWEQSRLRESIRLFEHAIVADSHYSTPYVGKAQCLLRIAQLGLVCPRDIIDEVRSSLKKALSLDPTQGEAEGTLAVLNARHEWKWRDAERRFARALELAPFSAEIHNNYAFNCLAATGQLENALAANRRARELDPYLPSAMTDFPWLLLLKRSYVEAECACRDVLAYTPDNRAVRAYLGASLFLQGQVADGLREFDHSVAVEANPLLQALACGARSSIGEQQQARDLLAALEARAAKEFVPAMAFAVLYTALSRLDDALEAMVQAYENREFLLCHAKHLFIFDPYRDSASFQQLMRKVFTVSG